MRKNGSALGLWEIRILGLLLACLITTAFQGRAEPCRRQTDSQAAKPVWIVGHRGAAGLWPENTLAGFSGAIELGVDALELDVLMTADGHLVVHHDFFLKPEITRIGGGAWLNDRQTIPINELTLKQVKTFDVGRLKPGTRYADRYPEQLAVEGERIPLLSEVIDLVRHAGRNTVQLWIEIKTSPEKPDTTPSPETVAERVVGLLREEAFSRRVKILSFDWRSLVHVQKIAPFIPTVYLSSNTLQFKYASFANPWESDWTAGIDIGKHEGSFPRAIRAAGGSWWASEYTQIDEKQVNDAHRLGICVAVWTPDAGKKMEKLIHMGVDAVITNRPDVLISTIRSGVSSQTRTISCTFADPETESLPDPLRTADGAEPGP